ncbi:MAG: cation:proton antiporter [Pirellulaceae bacterium]
MAVATEDGAVAFFLGTTPLHDLEIVTIDLIVILIAGFLAGAICTRIRVSTIVGYLIVGAVVGQGGFQLISTGERELKHLAEIGALFLLFSIGMEMSLAELKHLGWRVFVGGVLQMGLVAGPAAAVFLVAGLSWQQATVLGFGVALSSTVLVFRALKESGVASSPGGLRSVSILLFQDMAIVPLMLAVPVLAGSGDLSGVALGKLALVSLLFVVLIPVSAIIVQKLFVPVLLWLRSRELMVLFVLAVLAGVCFGAYEGGLPLAFGAFGAGLILSGNRLTHQIDALVLPFRESFAAIFFISLGSLLNIPLLLENPLVVILGFPLVLALKTGAAAVALWATGLPWRSSLYLGLGLSQIGELSFLLLSAGMIHGLIDPAAYNQMLVLAISSLIVTPGLISFALHRIGDRPELKEEQTEPDMAVRDPVKEAVVIGIGTIARQVASRLEIMGVEVRFIDLSAVNTYPLQQLGFRTVTGDATKKKVLEEAEVAHANLILVAVPVDEASVTIVRNVRQLNPTATILARCRYQKTKERLEAAGANFVNDEESQTALALIAMIEFLERQTSK